MFAFWWSGLWRPEWVDIRKIGWSWGHQTTNDIRADVETLTNLSSASGSNLSTRIFYSFQEFSLKKSNLSFHPPDNMLQVFILPKEVVQLLWFFNLLLLSIFSTSFWGFVVQISHTTIFESGHFVVRHSCTRVTLIGCVGLGLGCCGHLSHSWQLRSDLSGRIIDRTPALPM